MVWSRSVKCADKRYIAVFYLSSGAGDRSCRCIVFNAADFNALNVRRIGIFRILRICESRIVPHVITVIDLDEIDVPLDVVFAVGLLISVYADLCA